MILMNKCLFECFAYNILSANNFARFIKTNSVNFEQSNLNYEVNYTLTNGSLRSTLPLSSYFRHQNKKITIG